MTHKRERRPGRGGAVQQDHANDTAARVGAPAIMPYGPVSMGLGYRATFALTPAVDGVASLAIEWEPVAPSARDMRRIHDRYQAELGKFSANIAQVPSVEGRG